MDDAPAGTRAGRETVCPTCAAPAERGQLVCLECGSRVALSYRRPPSWKIPVAISAVLLLLAGAGAVLAYQAVSGDAEREVAATPVKVSDQGQDDDESGAGDAEEKLLTPETPGENERPETSATGEETAPATPEKPEPDRDANADGLVKDGALYTWPRDLEGFTVVLLSNEDRPSAEAFAESAAKTRGEKIGVIRSNDFETLPTDFFVVFAGKYSNRAKADAAATRLGRSFEGAFPQIVRR